MNTQQDSVAVLRVSEIEDAIAAGKMTAAQVFTQMRQLLQSQQVASADRGEAVAMPASNWCPTCGKRPNDMLAIFCNDGFHGPATPPSPAESAEGDSPDWDEGARHTSIVEIARAAGAEKLGVLAAPLKQVAVAGDHGVELREPMEDYFDAGQMHAALDRAAAPSGVSDADWRRIGDRMENLCWNVATAEKIDGYLFPEKYRTCALELLQQWRTAKKAQPQPGRVEGYKPIERDEAMDREYIPMPGGWEVQTKGKGSTFRISDESGDRRLAIEPRPYLHETLTNMARDINAAWKAAAPTAGGAT